MNKLLTLLTIAAVATFSYGMSSPVENNAQQKTYKTSARHDQVYTKPHAGIELNYNRPKLLQAGDSFELILNFKTRVSADSLQINMKYDNGLQPGISQLQYYFAAPENKKNQIIIPLTVLEDGRFFIDISAALITNGKAQARSFSIPVTVGNPANYKTPTGAEINSGYRVVPSQGVISMPATETTD